MVRRAADKLVVALQHHLTYLQVKTVVRALGRAQYLVIAILPLAPLVSRAAIQVGGARAIQVIFAIVTPADTAAVTYKVVRRLNTPLQNGVGVGGFHRRLASARVDRMRGHPRYRSTGSAARQQMACIAIFPVADIFHATEGCGYLGQAGQAKGSGVFKTPVAPCFCRQVNLAQRPIAQDELVLRQRLVGTLGIGVQVEGHRAAIADFQQFQPCAIDNTFQSLVIGRVAQQNTMAGSCAHLGRQRNSMLTHPIYTEDFFHVRLVNHPKLLLVADAVIQKTKIFELSFLDARLCATARHLEAFS
ncbi:hypothetical protein D3C76_1031060 [compost metagenome]